MTAAPRRSRPARRVRLALGVAALAVALAGCGSHAAATAPEVINPSTTTTTAGNSESSVGLRAVFMVQVHARVLVDQHGYALYMFVPDHQRQVTCVASCALSWPPVRVAAGTTPTAGAGVDAKLIGSDPDPAGGARVLTYNGYPLYTYAEDVQPGIAVGQGTDINGGYWYVLQPDGQPLAHLVEP